MLIKIIETQPSPWPLGHSRSGSSKVWDWSMGSPKMALGARLRVGGSRRNRGVRSLVIGVGDKRAYVWNELRKTEDLQLLHEGKAKKVTTFINTTCYVGALRVPLRSLQLPRKRGIFLIDIILTSMCCWERFYASLDKSVLHGNAYVIPISSGQWFWNRIHFRTENCFL